MSKPQILIVQDNPADVELFRMALDQQEESYELVVLRDGAEALRYVHERHIGVREPEPCVIVLNLYLPKYDGMEVLDALKAEPRLKHVQVVMLTSTVVAQREEWKLNGVGAVLRQKPRQFSEVLDLARYVIDLCNKAVLIS